MNTSVARIVMPAGLEKAYNPGMCDYKGRRLMAIRAGRNDWSQIYIGELSRTFEFLNPKFLMMGQDPRLFAVNGRLHCSFVVDEGHHSIFQQGVALLRDELEVESKRIYSFGNTKEKNWIFFDHGSKLHAVYTICPHVVVAPEKKVIIAKTHYNHPWMYGDLHGGSPAVRVGDTMFAFFHCYSRKHMCRWKYDERVYCRGAYAFDASPPFRVKFMTPFPLWAGNAVDNIQFAGGAIFEDGQWYVSCGVNDCRSEIHTFSHDDLLASMEHVTANNSHVSKGVRGWLI
jgi:hypothetical protein